MNTDPYVIGLLALSFNSGLKTIGSYSFAGCSGVSSVSLPDGLATIGTSAFQGLSKPASLTVPDSVTSIGASAFAGWSSLKELTVPFVGGSRLPTSSGSYWYGGILGWLFGSTSYTGGSQTYQYAYAYTLTSGAWSLDTSTSTNKAYYIPSSLAKVTVTDASMIGGGAFMEKFFTDNGIKYLIDASIIYDFTVEFVDEDGTVISTATYHWGDSVAAPSDPTKASDSMYDYTFAGWTPEVAA